MADNKEWDTGGGNWNTPGNWRQPGVPAPGDFVFLGSRPAAENATVSLNINDTISRISITDGMTLRTNGFALSVTGDTTLNGRNEVNNVVYSSRLRVSPSGQAFDYRTQDFTLLNEASLDMDGGILRVNGVLTAGAATGIYGNGTINLEYDSGPSLALGGFLQPFTEGLTINQNGLGKIDLDGSGVATRINITTSQGDGDAFASLTVNGTLLADAFDGELWLGGGNALSMNLSGGGWATGPGSAFDIFSYQNVPAAVNGSAVTLGGAMEVRGIGLFNAQTTFAGTAGIVMFNNGELRLAGSTEFAGASFGQADGTADGLITVNGGLTVSASTVVNLPQGVVDWDGDGGGAVTTINPGVTLTLNAGAIENDGDGAYSGTANVGAGAALAVNTPAPWTNDGTVSLGGGAALTGSGIVNTDTIRGAGTVTSASLVNDGTLAGVNGTLTVNVPGALDLDGASGGGVLNAREGNLTVQGVNGLPVFTGTVNAGLAGGPGTFLMPAGGITNEGSVNLAGGTYNAGLRQDGQLTVSFPSRLVSDATFGAGGVNALNADLRFEGNGLVEAGANFNGSAAFIILEGSQLNGEHQAGMGVRVTNEGRLEPGMSIGRFEVLSLTNEATGVLEVELGAGGGVPGVGHDVLDARLTATLSGTLDVRFLNGFLPADGDSFVVLRTLLGISGEFDTVLQPGGDVLLTPVYDANTLTLVAQAVPEPGSLLLAVCGAGLILPRRRR